MERRLAAEREKPIRVGPTSATADGPRRAPAGRDSPREGLFGSPIQALGQKGAAILGGRLGACRLLASGPTLAHSRALPRTQSPNGEAGQEPPALRVKLRSRPAGSPPRHHVCTNRISGGKTHFCTSAVFSSFSSPSSFLMLFSCSMGAGRQGGTGDGGRPRRAWGVWLRGWEGGVGSAVAPLAPLRTPR